MKKVKFEADLHNHTTASDGMYTPAELVQKANDMGIQVLGITDHDTIEGLQDALNAASQTDVEILPGMEITVRFREEFFVGSLHLLAYFSEELLNCDEFTNETLSVLSLGRGAELTRLRIEAINENFAPKSKTPLMPRELTANDVYRHGKRISRRHFALALNDMGVNRKETISQIIGNDSLAYVPSGSELHILQNYLVKWPLVLVLAHPAAGSYPGDNFYKEVLPPFGIVDRLFHRFLKVGLSGLEIEYPGHTTEWKQTLREYLAAHSLLLETGGSDCHDETNRPLGVTGVGMDVVERIRSMLI